MTQPVVIAVDGTAASGKGTLAKKLARHFGFAHLDSGSLYRLTALSVIEAGGDPNNPKDAERGAHAIDLSMAHDPKIRTAEMGKAASQLSAFPAVRSALLDFQRSFLARPPRGKPGGRHGRARHRNRDLPHRDGKALRGCASRSAGSPALA